MPPNLFYYYIFELACLGIYFLGKTLLCFGTDKKIEITTNVLFWFIIF